MGVERTKHVDVLIPKHIVLCVLFPVEGKTIKFQNVTRSIGNQLLNQVEVTANPNCSNLQDQCVRRLSWLSRRGSQGPSTGESLWHLCLKLWNFCVPEQDDPCVMCNECTAVFLSCILLYTSCSSQDHYNRIVTWSTFVTTFRCCFTSEGAMDATFLHVSRELRRTLPASTANHAPAYRSPGPPRHL